MWNCLKDPMVCRTTSIFSANPDMPLPVTDAVEPSASKPRLVLLAAGQGSRLGELTKSRHKSLLPVAGEPLLRRTVAQFHRHGFESISVVVGHIADSIEHELSTLGFPVETLPNPNYATDTNIGSLIIGLAGRMEPTLVVEADIAFDDGAVEEIARVVMQDYSIWFTRGMFREYKLGGCMRVGSGQDILDLRYFPCFKEEFAEYR
jgi:NDP-sugar pyrophosphorylase family protein